MAQLSADSFAFGGDLLAVDEATALLEDRFGTVAGVERVPLERADGRVLAETVVAPIDLPPFDNSAVDGFAVRFGDLAPDAETTLAVEGRVAAGAEGAVRIAEGRAARIFTGAPMPAGADTVYMQEDCRIGDGVVILPPGLKRGANRRLHGEDVARGSQALTAGQRLTPQHVGLLAALGIRDVPVRRPLKVAVFSTGDEIVSPGEPLPPAGLYDANRFVLRALLARLAADVTDLGILPDDLAAVAAALATASGEHDLIVTSGGVSTGEEDHVRAAVEDIGSLVFWRLAIKPGRPVAMGMISGNPVAMFVTFAHVVRPLLDALSGASPVRVLALPVVADFSYRKKEGRREYVRVSLHRAGDGRTLARKHPRDGAGVISSLTETDGLVELREETTSVAPGDTVGYFPYAVLR
jgi:molybdopterin molybdotransferase